MELLARWYDQPVAEERDLARLQAPTLVLAGHDDGLVPPDHAVKFASTIPRARLEAYPGAGHMLMMTQGRDVRGWLRELITW